jgi:hypothetical protein
MYSRRQRVGYDCACRFMITQHPEVEKNVLAELDSLGLLVTPERPNPRPLEYDDLTKLTYTNNCIKARKPCCYSHKTCCDESCHINVSRITEHIF